MNSEVTRQIRELCGQFSTLITTHADSIPPKERTDLRLNLMAIIATANDLDAQPKTPKTPYHDFKLAQAGDTL